MVRSRPFPARLAVGALKLVAAFGLGSILWVLLYRFINPPVTITMARDLIAGRGATRDWMPIGAIDRDVVRAAIASEDSKFCRHDGFDLAAIESAMQRNASGGRIRGGSTISQQTAKNAFLWQGGGYPRKAAEAWFTLLIEHLWTKRRIMEVYLNLAETGIATYGVNAGAQRYYGHDAGAMTPLEAARIAAVLPLPKERGAVAPVGFTRRYGNTISARIGVVARDALDACVYADVPAVPERRELPKRAAKPSARLPGSDYESAPARRKTAEPVSEAPPAEPAAEPATELPLPAPQIDNQSAL